MGYPQSSRHTRRVSDGIPTEAGALVGRFPEQEKTMTRKSKELLHEGKYAAEIPVDLIEDDTAWSPYLSPADAKKLDAVRLALRQGDLVEAAKYGRIFELMPIAAK